MLPHHPFIIPCGTSVFPFSFFATNPLKTVPNPHWFSTPPIPISIPVWSFDFSLLFWVINSLFQSLFTARFPLYNPLTVFPKTISATAFNTYSRTTIQSPEIRSYTLSFTSLNPDSTHPVRISDQPHKTLWLTTRVSVLSHTIPHCLVLFNALS